ncbi:uncharacterized protein PO1_contig-013-8 [Mycobacterium sp. PO1]|nr:uncharacterized protein PO1_contig-013-8 [Mycobacterium sp. PO1]GFM25170.1 uncharacterized protein PO2_contig-062-8 [Mycobacterium sp. PO2]
MRRLATEQFNVNTAVSVQPFWSDSDTYIRRRSQNVGSEAEDYIGDLLAGLEGTAKPRQASEDVPSERMGGVSRRLGTDYCVIGRLRGGLGISL